MSDTFITNYKVRVATWGVGLVASKLFAIAFDYGLYPLVMWKFGLLYGFIIMAPISFVTCYLSILFYDWLKKDWLTVETIKEIKEYEGNNRAIRFFSTILKKSEIFAIFILSVKYDPFITVIFLRHGAYKYDGMSRRDWRNFLLSSLIGNGYWAIVTFTGVSIIVNFKHIWHFIVS
jgi:hypothetical protein